MLSECCDACPLPNCCLQVFNYPVVNHGRVRGLLQRLRSRLMHVQGERAALQGQLAQLPLEDSPDSQAPFRAKVSHLLT